MSASDAYQHTLVTRPSSRIISSLCRQVMALGSISILGIGLAACGTESKEIIGGDDSSASASASSTESMDGEYQPATSEHPARNVPKPELPEKAKEESFEGAKAFMQYWTDSYNYLIQTGDDSYIREVTDSENIEYLGDYSQYAETYTSGKWVSGRTWETFIDHQSAEGFSSFEGHYSASMRVSRTKGVVYSKNGKQQTIEEDNFNNQPLNLILKRSDSEWEFVDLVGIPGVDYEG